MSEEERRRCCLLGGCGCGQQQQIAALAEEIEAAGSAHKAAAILFDIFGYGPHHERLAALGLIGKPEDAGPPGGE